MQRHMHHQQKPVKNSRQFRFMDFMRNGITDAETLESPMAVYEWFIQEWDRPLNSDGMHQAWLAAWAITIHEGAVDL